MELALPVPAIFFVKPVSYLIMSVIVLIAFLRTCVVLKITFARNHPIKYFPGGAHCFAGGVDTSPARILSKAVPGPPKSGYAKLTRWYTDGTLEGSSDVSYLILIQDLTKLYVRFGSQSDHHELDSIPCF